MVRQEKINKSADRDAINIHPLYDCKGITVMYLQNKYTSWYYQIIARAQSRQTQGYVERHHVIPRSLGGINESDNLVALTAREHFVCHLLLTRMTTGQSRCKMISAVFYLTGGQSLRQNRVKYSSMYERLKKEQALNASKQHKGRRRPPRSLEAKQNYSQSKTGRNNPNSIGYFITPWGKFESSRLAADNCPVEITGNYILRLCRTNNQKPINLLSVCRSRAYLKHRHIGLTPAQLGFGFHHYK